MSLLLWSRKIFIVLTLVLVLTFATTCSGSTQAAQTITPSAIESRVVYKQLERGIKAATGQDFSKWVVQTAEGLVQEASFRDHKNLVVVLTPQVRPNEIQPLMKSLVQGFQCSFPNQDLLVLMYSSNRQLILTARYRDGIVKLTLH